MHHDIMTTPRRAAFLALLVLTVGTPPLGADDKKPSTGTGISGRVYTYDPNAKGLVVLAGATIELRQSEGGALKGKATSNAAGYYKIPNPASPTPLAPGVAYYYRVTLDGYKEEKGRGFNLKQTVGDNVKNFTLEKGTTDPNARSPEAPRITVGQLRGQVYGKTSTGDFLGVNGATVNLRKVGSLNVVTVFASPPVEGQNSSGYQCDLEAGQWEVTVRAAGFISAPKVEVQVVADQMAIQDLILTRPPEPEPKYQGLKGTITLVHASPGNAPPITVSIYRLPYRRRDKPTPAPLDGGNYQVDRAPGRYFVRAEADGYLPKRSVNSDVLAGAYTVVDLKLERRPAGLVVTVYDTKSNKPLGYATLKVRRPNQPLGTPQETDAVRGQSTFTLTPANDYQVLAEMDGYKPDGKPGVQVRAGVRNTLELYLTPIDQPPAVVVITPPPVTPLLPLVPPPVTLPPPVTSLPPPPPAQTYRLTLAILYMSGDKPYPIAGAAIKIKRFGRVIEGSSNDQGNYTCAVPVMGKYQVDVTKTGYVPRSNISVDVANLVTSAKIFLTLPRRTMNVLVREGGRRGTVPIAGAYVKIRNARQQVVKEGYTTDLGRFRAENLDVGVYTVEAYKEYYTQRSRPQSDLTHGDDQPEAPLFRDGGPGVVPKPPVSTEKPKVKVPDVTKSTLEAAASQLTAAGLTPRVKDPKRASGLVATQDPVAGSMVLPGTVVVVDFPVVRTSNSYPTPTSPPPTTPTPAAKVAVPDLKNSTVAEARVQLTAAGLQMRAYGVAAGRATVQSPAAASMVQVGTSVDVTFAAAPAPPPVSTVPKPPPAPVVTAPAVPRRVIDNGGYFKPDTIKQADEAIARIKQRFGKDVWVETFKEIPPSLKKLYYNPNDKKNPFPFGWWANSLLQAHAFKDGISILVCTDPSRLQIEAGASRRPLEKSLYELIAGRFAKGQYDAGLLEGIAHVEQALASAGSGGGVNTQPKPQPPAVSTVPRPQPPPVTTSAKPVTVAVPDLRDSTLAEARAKLTAAGLQMRGYGVANGRGTTQSPAARSMVQRDTVVDVTFAAAPAPPPVSPVPRPQPPPVSTVPGPQPPAMVRVPDVGNLQLAAAKQRLEALGLVVRWAGANQGGGVRRQTPVAGTQVQPGTSVTLEF